MLSEAKVVCNMNLFKIVIFVAAPVGSSLVRMAASTSNPNARLYYSFAAPQQAFTADKLTISVQTFNFSVSY
jgi:hypothetical protein